MGIRVAGGTVLRHLFSTGTVSSEGGLGVVVIEVLHPGGSEAIGHHASYLSPRGHIDRTDVVLRHVLLFEPLVGILLLLQVHPETIGGSHQE